MCLFQSNLINGHFSAEILTYTSVTNNIINGVILFRCPIARAQQAVSVAYWHDMDGAWPSLFITGFFCHVQLSSVNTAYYICNRWPQSGFRDMNDKGR